MIFKHLKRGPVLHSGSGPKGLFGGGAVPRSLAVPTNPACDVMPWKGKMEMLHFVVKCKREARRQKLEST